MNPWTLPNLNGRSPCQLPVPSGRAQPRCTRRAWAGRTLLLHMLPSTERCGGLDLTSLSPRFVCEDGHCGPPVEARASCRAFANLLLGNFGILALRPQVRRVADKVEQKRECVLAVQDALDVE